MAVQQPIDLKTQTPSTTNAATSKNVTASDVAGTLYTGSGLAGQTYGNDLQKSLFEQQMGLMPFQLQNQQNILGENYGFQQQQYGVQGQQIGLSQLENRQQQQQLGTEYGYQQQQNVLSGQGIQASLKNIMQNFNTQMGQLGLSQTQANQGMAGSGTYTTGAKKQSDQGFALERQGLTQNMQYAVGENQRQMKGLHLSEAEQKEQFGYSTEQLKNGYQSLNLQLKNLGISEAQAKSQYNNALQQLGLQNIMDTDQLAQQIAVMYGGGWSPLTSVQGQLQQALPGIMPSASQQGGK